MALPYAKTVWVDNSTPDINAANLNHLEQGVFDVSGGWGTAGAFTAYTPAWTATVTPPVLGNGTISGAYFQVGKLVVGRMSLTMGSTTTYGSGSYQLSLPTTINAAYQLYFPMGNGAIVHGGNIYGFIAGVGSSTTVLWLTTAQPAVTSSPSTPVTFASGDTVYVDFTYEAA
jgi:hypothetical protein